MEIPEKGFVATVRAAPRALQAQWKLVSQKMSAVDFFRVVPIPAAVLNSHRQILFANAAFAQFTECRPETIIGKRPGEAWKCVHFKSKRGGCGGGVACRTCDAALVLQNSSESSGFHYCRIERQKMDGIVHKIEFRMCARPVEIENQEFTAVTVEDITEEKQRYALERIFYHELLNTATGLQGLATLMAEAKSAPEESRSMAKWVSRSAGRLNEMVNAQQMMSAAQCNKLSVAPQAVDLKVLIAQVLKGFPGEDLPRRCPTLLPQFSPPLETDPAILRRVLLNLSKALIEDSQADQSITFDATAEGESVHIRMHSPVVVDDKVKAQYLCRSVSQGTNRELITHAALLLTESCLGGRISFESAAPDGTTVVVTLPQNWKSAR